MNGFKINVDRVKEFKEKQLTTLATEESRNGGYHNWYDSLGDFRKYIRKRYIKANFIRKTYKSKIVLVDSGDVIDHHSLSYLSPMNFTRIGWNDKRFSPSEHLNEIVNFFTIRKKRFIYVALPNKGSIYPEIICQDSAILEREEIGNSPQWRKYIRDVLKKDVEVIDMYPIFIRNKDKGNLFSKNHHISPFGAEITGKAISDYLKETTYNLDNNFKLLRERCTFYTSDYINPEICKAQAYTYFLNYANEKIYYWNQNTKDSKIAIFGDCNLQAYSSFGAGISSDLSFFLRYPIYNAGRLLIFGFEDKPLHMKEIIQLLNYDIIIYLAFVSAPFVRSSQLSFRRPRLEYKWQHLKLYS